MAVLFSAAFTGGTDGDDLTGYTPETGTSFARHASYSGVKMGLDGTGFAFQDTFTLDAESLYYADPTPGNADYYVETVMIRKELNAGSIAGIAGRIDTGANTFYRAVYDQTFSQLRLYKRIAGIDTGLGTPYAFTWFDEASHTIRLTMTGTGIAVSLNGTDRVTATDSAISAAGKGGMYTKYYNVTPPDPPDLRYDSFVVNGTAGGSGGKPTYYYNMLRAA